MSGLCLLLQFPSQEEEYVRKMAELLERGGEEEVASQSSHIFLDAHFFLFVFLGKSSVPHPHPPISPGKLRLAYERLKKDRKDGGDEDDDDSSSSNGQGGNSSKEEDDDVDGMAPLRLKISEGDMAAFLGKWRRREERERALKEEAVRYYSSRTQTYFA